jgi:hypothetical protein
MDGYDQPLSVGGMALDVIGAKRKSDQQIVPETHLFLWDGVTESVAWATAAAAPSVGHETRQFWGRILEHHVTHDPGYSELGLPNPHQPGWEKEPSATEIYYAGANWGQPQTTYAQDDLACGDERATVVSSTGTYQLFDPARLACITGPFVAVGEGTSPYTTTLIGGYQAFYRVNFSTRTGTTQRLWHYRMQSAKVFTRRYVAGGVNPLATGIDEALLFLVVERYPYISGTGYINDLPQIWVGITTVQGQTVRVLRDWQYGLAGAALITGNGHRLFWSCGIGAIQPVTRYLYTDLDAGVEMTLASAQALLVLASKRHLLPPDFCWERLEPQGFHAIDRLPALEADELLAEYGALLGTEGAPEGSVRVVNDEEILSPLERYQTS